MDLLILVPILRHLTARVFKNKVHDAVDIAHDLDCGLVLRMNNVRHIVSGLGYGCFV